MKLNLGCGAFPMRDWINVDLVDRRDQKDAYGPPELLADACRLPFRERSFERIYAGHLVEHLTLDVAEDALFTWMTLLVPGGVLGIVVPDLARMMQWARDDRMERDFVWRCLPGEEADHVTVWTYDQLFAWVDSAGNLRPRPLALSDWPVVSDEDWQVGVEIERL